MMIVHASEDKPCYRLSIYSASGPSVHHCAHHRGLHWESQSKWQYVAIFHRAPFICSNTIVRMEKSYKPFSFQCAPHRVESFVVKTLSYSSSSKYNSL